MMISSAATMDKRITCVFTSREEVCIVLKGERK